MEITRTNSPIIMTTGFLGLNDDCLMEIMSYLNIRELYAMERVCTDLKNVVESVYKRFKTLNFDELAERKKISLIELKLFAKRVGECVTNLTARSSSFEIGADYYIIDILLDHFKKVQNLNIADFPLLFLKMDELIEISCNLKSAKFMSCDLNDDVQRCLAVAGNLESIDLSYNPLNGKCFEELSNLREFDATCCEVKFEGFFISLLQRNPTLKKVGIPSGCITQDSIEAIRRFLPELEAVSFSHFCFGGCHINLQILANLPNLTEVKLECFNQGNIHNFMESLAEYDRLTCLNLRISDYHSLLHVKRFTNLKYINICCRKLKNEHLMEFMSKKTLQKIIVDSMLLTDDLCKFITECPSLTYLEVRRAEKITEVFLDGLTPYLDGRTVPLTIYVFRTGIKESNERTLHPMLRLNIEEVKMSYSDDEDDEHSQSSEDNDNSDDNDSWIGIGEEEEIGDFYEESSEESDE
ncbi:hypothetical protein DMENIID0001_095110 [Sergentomyia squamirostris]